MLVSYLFSGCSKPFYTLYCWHSFAHYILHTSLPVGLLLGSANGRQQRIGRWQEERRAILPVSDGPATADG